MSYEMKYHPDLFKKQPFITKVKKTTVALRWICLLTALILGISFRSKNFWFEFLIPGDSAVTVAAVETFSDDLREGVSFEAAFENFCLEITASD